MWPAQRNGPLPKRGRSELEQQPAWKSVSHTEDENWLLCLRTEPSPSIVGDKSALSESTSSDNWAAGHGIELQVTCINYKIIYSHHRFHCTLKFKEGEKKKKKGNQKTRRKQKKSSKINPQQPGKISTYFPQPRQQCLFDQQQTSNIWLSNCPPPLSCPCPLHQVWVHNYTTLLSLSSSSSASPQWHHTTLLSLSSSSSVSPQLHYTPVLILFIKCESTITLHSCPYILHQVRVHNYTTLLSLSSSSSVSHNYTPVFVLFIKCESTVTLHPCHYPLHQVWVTITLLPWSSSSASPQWHYIPVLVLFIQC